MADSLKETLTLRNCETVPLKSIPVMGYGAFYRTVSSLMQLDRIHCTAYFGHIRDRELIFFCALADDELGVVHLLSHKRDEDDRSSLKSLTPEFPAMHFFERVIREKFAIEFEGHPWLKPVRYPCDRHDKDARINDYPFYKISGEELHEVGVGPIHAGIIEPGHFRFTCNGEMVLHLEIQLGWQHRGMEKALLKGKTLLERTVLSEQIAGDTAVGHSLAFSHAMESLGKAQVSSRLEKERVIALELERIAVHTGDMSALCTDVAYQLGNAVMGVLRTPIVNFMQDWCGNRLGKSMIRPGGTWRPLTKELKEKLLAILNDYEVRFLEVARNTRYMPGIENRFENIGTITSEQARKLGTVGMAARMSGIPRDIRSTHPAGGYKEFSCEPVLLERGDVLSRFILRKLEIADSVRLIRAILEDLTAEAPPRREPPAEELNLTPDSLTLSLVEGWRGEICHTLVTDGSGNLAGYDINDPSVHNWKALELSLRNLEISDFPINNKSYNLSYCGHDL